MTDVPRIGPDAVRSKLERGEGTLLVCAYEEEEKFQKNALQGAISLSEFRRRLPSIAKERELVFYCA